MSFNFAPPGQEEAAATPAPAEDAPSGPLTAAQRLAALKAKLAVARKTNHKAVVEEDRREKLGPEGLRDESKQKSYERQKKEGKVETDTSKIMSTTAAVAQDKQDKLDKKARRRGEYGWDVFNNEAQYRHFKKRVRRAEEDGRLGGEEDVGPEEDPDPLNYGHAPPVPKEKLAALADDMNDAALRNAQFSRRRAFNEDADVTYINRRNEVFNKKADRAFDPYTKEIRQNLERGTAL